MSTTLSKNKRKREECDDARTARKKPKHNVLSRNDQPHQTLNQNGFLLFEDKFANIDIERTLSELDNIPKHWDQYISNNKIHNASSTNELKLKYLSKKFDIASKTVALSLFPTKQKYHFMDEIGNICMIADSNNPEFAKQFQNELAKSDECISQIFFNKKICFNLKFFTIELDGDYVGILRVPYANFCMRYNHSFDKFLIEHAFIFHDILSGYNFYQHLQNITGGCMRTIDENPNINGVIYSFRDFFDNFVSQDSEIAPSSIGGLCNEYSHLFDVYCGDRRYVSVTVFMILYELFDKAWIQKQEIGDAIDLSWKNIGKAYKFEHFEEGVSKSILQFLFPVLEAYDFGDFIKRQLKLEIEVECEEELDAVNVFCGRYTNMYEWQYYEKNGHFLANPLRYKYLTEDELQIQKDKWLKKQGWSAINKCRLRRLFYIQAQKVKFQNTCFGDECTIP